MNAAKGVAVSVLTGITAVLLLVGVAAVALVRPAPDDPIVGNVVGSPTAAAASPPVCPGPSNPTSGALLGQLLIPTPNGFVRQADQAVHAGVLTEAEIAADSEQPTQATVELGDDGFQGAVLRVWIDASAQEQVQVTLVQFSCAAGASEYANTEVANTYGMSDANPFVIAGVSSARGERSEIPDSKGHYLQVVGLVSGSIYAQTDAFTPDLNDGSLAGAIATLQSGALAPI